MCGIFFYKNPKGVTAEPRYEKALSRMVNRGPDSQDLYFGPDFVIGHTRLSIIDLNKRANQPFWDQSGRFVISYNGEIYNFREIQTQLVQAGRVLRTESDTETLLEAILTFGLSETLTRLRGMFAFVLYDTEADELTAVRDPFGQKPLYYFNQKGCIGIASDILSLLDVSDTTTPYIPAYSVYMCANEQGTRGAFHTDRTFFEGISMLPAGHIHVVKNGIPSTRSYFEAWQLYDGDTAREYASLSSADACAGLKDRLVQAVNRHLVSDVDTGILLSGGIDSSLIYWLAHEVDENVSVFTKLSPGIEVIPLSVIPRILEQRPANTYFNVQKPESYLAELTQFISASRAPSRWGSGPSMSHLCALARRNDVTVLLSGDCADEYISGYGHYEAEFSNPAVDLFEPSTLTALNAASHFYVSDRAAEYETRERDTRRRIIEHLGEMDGNHSKHVQATLLHDTSTFLQTCNLPHSDAYSMKESVEVRNPMLDLDLVKYVINLPERFKTGTHHSGHFGKSLLRDLAGKEIGEFINQKKEGTRNYAMTLADTKYWQFREFSINEIVTIPSSLTKREIIRLVNLEIFHRRFFRQERDPLSSIMTAAGGAALAQAPKC